MARSEPRGEHHVDATRRLREYIDRTAGSIPKFCQQHGWDENMRIEIQRVINGKRKRISAKFALRIQDATGGADGPFPVSAWIEADGSGTLPALDADRTA